MTATYLIKEFIEAIGTTALGSDLILYPGTGAEDSGTTFGTYNVISGLDYEQPYVHRDLMEAHVYCASVNDLYGFVALVLTQMNSETMAEHDLNTNDEDIRFIDVVVSVISSTEHSIINGSEVFGTRFAILYEYVEI